MSRVRFWPYRMHFPFVSSPFMTHGLSVRLVQVGCVPAAALSVYPLTPCDVPLQVCRGHAVDQPDASLYVRGRWMSMHYAGKIPQSRPVRSTRGPEMYFPGVQGQKRQRSGNAVQCASQASSAGRRATSAARG